jgi:hypothetical protein
MTPKQLKGIIEDANGGCAESMFWLAQYSFIQKQHDVGIGWLFYYCMRAKQDFQLIRSQDQIGKWPIIYKRIAGLIKKYPQVKDHLLIDPEEIENKRQAIAKNLKQITEDKNLLLPHPYWLLQYFADVGRNSPQFIEPKLWQSQRVKIVNELIKPQKTDFFTPIYCPANYCLTNQADDSEDMPLPPLPSTTDENLFVENER